MAPAGGLGVAYARAHVDGGLTCGLRLAVLEYAPYLPKGESRGGFKVGLDGDEVRELSRNQRTDLVVL